MYWSEPMSTPQSDLYMVDYLYGGVCPLRHDLVAI